MLSKQHTTHWIPVQYNMHVFTSFCPESFSVPLVLLYFAIFSAISSVSFLLFAWRWLKCPTVADKIAQHKKTLLIWVDYTVQKVWAESKLASAMKDQELDMRWCFQVVRYLSWVKPVLPSAPERLHFSTLSQIYWHWKKKTIVCALDHDWQRKFLKRPLESPVSPLAL